MDGRANKPGAVEISVVKKSVMIQW